MTQGQCKSIAFGCIAWVQLKVRLRHTKEESSPTKAGLRGSTESEGLGLKWPSVIETKDESDGEENAMAS